MLSVAAAVRRQDGFTLIELLVATAASIVLLLGLTTLLISVLDGTQQADARIDATRQTRLALANIENELHSACVGTGTAQNLAPIQAGSDQDTLEFVSYTGTTVNPTPLWHELHFTGSTLTDTTYPVSGSAGDWTKGAKKITTQTVLAHVTATPGIPFFQYFAYEASPGPDNEDYWTIPDGDDVLPNGVTLPQKAESFPLSPGASGSAIATVEVLITLDGGPSTDTAAATTPGVSDPETDAISLRLTTPPNLASAGAASSYGPCE